MSVFFDLACVGIASAFMLFCIYFISSNAIHTCIAWWVYRLTWKPFSSSTHAVVWGSVA